jgi:hypothetical protein
VPSDRFYGARTASPRVIHVKYLLLTFELSSRSKNIPGRIHSSLAGKTTVSAGLSLCSSSMNDECHDLRQGSAAVRRGFELSRNCSVALATVNHSSTGTGTAVHTAVLLQLYSCSTSIRVQLYSYTRTGTRTQFIIQPAVRYGTGTAVPYPCSVRVHVAHCSAHGAVLV